MDWKDVVAKVRKENPGLMLKDHLKMASKIYKPAEKAVEGAVKAVKSVAKKTAKVLKGGKKGKKSKGRK